MAETFSYDFFAPRQIVFGWGRRRDVGRLVKPLGRRAFVISGLPAAMASEVLSEIDDLLRRESIEPIRLATLLHEPEVDDVDRTAAEARALGIGLGDLLLAVGGGAAIDLAKAAAAMAVNRESDTVKDYLENVGRDLKLTVPPLPVIAMPTTAGTGAEATRNAVISSYDPPFKKSLRDNGLMPSVALVDPELTVTMPAATTAASGMDAITQLIESYVSKKSQPIPCALAVQGLRMAIPAIAEAVEQPDCRAAREAMAHAALLSGMALANSGLGMAHGVAPALGTHGRVPHGVACAILLPAAIRANMSVCRDEFARLGHLVFGLSTKNTEQAAEGFAEKIEQLCDRVGVPRRLAEVGVRREQLPTIVRDSRGSSMSGNPRPLTDDELTDILERLL